MFPTENLTKEVERVLSWGQGTTLYNLELSELRACLGLYDPMDKLSVVHNFSPGLIWPFFFF